MELVESGIYALGEITWGSHFCHFYVDQTDLIETLVPYFKTGLDNREQCLWVTAEPLLSDDARAMLRRAVPNLDEYEAQGQIEIINYQDWYGSTESNDADSILKQWVDRQHRALEKGYKGLRLTGNTYWLEKSDWSAFTEYESKVNATFSRHRIVALCSYCMSRCGSHEVFEVLRNHDFALVRQKGQWELLESAPSLSQQGKLQTLNRELKSNLRQARLAAESANRLKTEFLANMSHEIRTPLGVILGFVELLQDESLTREEQQEYKDVIQRNGAVLSRLVDDILDLAKVEANRLQVENLRFSLRELVEEVVAMFTPHTRSKAVTLKLAFDDQLPAEIRSDPTRLRQILVNVIGNAVKFTEAGEVAITVQPLPQAPHKMMIRIRDQGIGMAENHQKELFQPFSQGDGSTTRKFGGTGLGLHLSQRLARALNGDLVLEHSSLGQGSSFLVTFADARVCSHDERGSQNERAQA